MTTTPEENPAIETRLAVVESQLVAVQEGQRQIIARLDAMQQASDSRMDSAQRDNNARLDAMQQASNDRLDAMQQVSNDRLDAMHRDHNARLDAMERSNNARFDALNSRIDRLFYTILGLGIAAIGTMIALDKVL